MADEMDHHWFRESGRAVPDELEHRWFQKRVHTFTPETLARNLWDLLRQLERGFRWNDGDELTVRERADKELGVRVLTEHWRESWPDSYSRWQAATAAEGAPANPERFLPPPRERPDTLSP